MAKKTLGLNEKENIPEGGGQPSNQEPKPDPFDLAVEDAEEEGKVIVSKDDLEKVTTEGKQYREGMLSAKSKLKSSKPSPEQGNYLTRSEFLKANEDEAIAKACQDEDIDSNWDEIMEYYHPKSGRKTVGGITSDIKRAHKLYRLENPVEDGDDEVAKADLGSERGKPSGKKDGGKGKGKKKGRKILTEGTSPNDWY